MANRLSLPMLIGLGTVILVMGIITLGLRALGLPRDMALYLAGWCIAGSVTLLYGRWLRRS